MLGAVFFVFLYPTLATASIFSSFLQKTATQSSASAAKYNSQNAPLLAPATNIDPRPATGGGDILIQDAVALVPSGSVAGASVEKKADSSQISVYVVQEGDTLSVIAGMFDVSTNTIIWANDIKGGVVRPGQELIILPITGIQHKVATGDTLGSLAKKYQSDSRDIAQYNNLPDDATLVVGETVIIPDGVVPAPVTKAVSSKAQVTQKTAASGYYSWPVAGGRLTQGIHGLNGVDIGGTKEGAAVLAAADGIVIVARDNGGWNGGYGNYVVIKHANGTQTLYAHAQTGSIRVSVGASVAKGQTIAGVGQTGKATGLHLHFEIRGAKNPFGK